jgi:hypothetical protein
MTISFSSDQTITALTVNANAGQSIVGNPTTLLAGGAATFVYRLSNTTWYVQASTAAIGNTGAGAPVVRIYTSPSPWTKPATLKAIKVTIVAGGGAGNNNSTSSRDGGGGAAGILYLQAPAIPGPVTVTVGAGGVANPAPATNGGSGGTSSFGALATATGGGGASTPNVSGAGGSMSASPTIIASGGTRGGYPAGGNSGLGFGIGALGSGFPTTGYGGGGVGVGNPSLPTLGGTGAAGVVVVEEFY